MENRTIRRNFGLDAVRAFAISLVLLAHGISIVGARLDSLGIYAWWIESPAGFYGVEIFFCLSGFLIGKALLDLETIATEHRASAIKIFLVRRWMRTLPLYYIVLAAYFLFPSLDTAAQTRVWSYAFFVQNVITPMPAGNWFGPSWSLVIEEWSYLLFPLLAFVIFRNVRRQVVAAACFFIVFSIVMRIVATDASSEWDGGIRKSAYANGCHCIWRSRVSNDAF